MEYIMENGVKYKVEYGHKCPKCGTYSIGSNSSGRGICPDCETEMVWDICTKRKCRVSKKSDKEKANQATYRIIPNDETDKAYKLTIECYGSTGKYFHNKYVAKSICRIDQSNNIYAPIWALDQIIIDEFKYIQL